MLLLDLSLSEYLYLFFPSQPSLPDPVSVISHLVQVLTPAEFWRHSVVVCFPRGQIIIIRWAAAHPYAMVHSSLLFDRKYEARVWYLLLGERRENLGVYLGKLYRTT